MSSRGWKTTEPDSDRLAPETPELVDAIGETLRRKGLSDHEIAEMAGYSEHATDKPLDPAKAALASRMTHTA
jgi:hypothetical protein